MYVLLKFERFQNLTPVGQLMAGSLILRLYERLALLLQCFLIWALLIPRICALWTRNCVLVLTPLDWLLPSLLGDDVAVLGCQVPLDSFFVLSFWWRLIVKLILHGVLIDHLPVLDAMELGLLVLHKS